MAAWISLLSTNLCPFRASCETITATIASFVITPCAWLCRVFTKITRRWQRLEAYMIQMIPLILLLRYHANICRNLMIWHMFATPRDLYRSMCSLFILRKRENHSSATFILATVISLENRCLTFHGGNFISSHSI